MKKLLLLPMLALEATYRTLDCLGCHQAATQVVRFMDYLHTTFVAPDL